MHPEFQQLLWVAAFVTVLPFLFGAAALFLGGRAEKPGGASTGAGARVDEETTRD